MKYRVILTGIVDNTAAGHEAFYQKFGQAYRMTPEQARAWIGQAQGMIYVYDEPGAAEQAKNFLGSIGGTAEVQGFDPALQPSPSPIGPTPAPGPRAWTPPPPKVYLRVYDLGALFENTFDIFFKNFVVLFLLQLIPGLPMLLLGIVGGIGAAILIPLADDHPGMIPFAIGAAVLLALVLLPMMIYIMLFCSTATIQAINENVHGQKPELVSTLKSVDYYLPLKLFATQLLAGLVFLACLAPPAVLALIAVLLTRGFGEEGQIVTAVVSGILIFLIMTPVVLYLASLFLFIQPATVLEDQWGIDGLKRSIELGKGYYLRNLGIFMLFILAVFIVMMVAQFGSMLIPIVGTLASAAMQMAIQPIIMTLIVLLYFDMKIRKGEQGLQTEFPGRQ